MAADLILLFWAVPSMFGPGRLSFRSQTFKFTEHGVIVCEICYRMFQGINTECIRNALSAKGISITISIIESYKY